MSGADYADGDDGEYDDGGGGYDAGTAVMSRTNADLMVSQRMENDLHDEVVEITDDSVDTDEAGSPGGHHGVHGQRSGLSPHEFDDAEVYAGEGNDLHDQGQHGAADDMDGAVYRSDEDVSADFPMAGASLKRHEEDGPGGDRSTSRMGMHRDDDGDDDDGAGHGAGHREEAQGQDGYDDYQGDEEGGPATSGSNGPSGQVQLGTLAEAGNHTAR